MRVPCVLVITINSLLSLALTNLINTSSEGLVVFESSAQDLNELIREINSYEADVLLLERNCAFSDEESLAKLLVSYPELLLIIVNEEDNWMHTYRRKNVLINSPADLLNVIQTA